MQDLQKRYQLLGAVTQGCRVNLRCKKTETLLHKGWKILTTHRSLQETMHMPCHCGKIINMVDVKGETRMTRRSTRRNTRNA